jgi:phosphate acyltransferase
VALDVMGADGHPGTIIEGGLWAARNDRDSLNIVLVGQRQLIDEYLSAQKDVPDNVSVQNAVNIVAMSDTPTDGIRKKDSSIAVGLKMQKDKKVDAFVSAGNTGAVMASSILILGRLENVTRPAIASFFPSSKERPTLVLDVGANAECKPINLYQFGVMGSVFYSVMFDINEPRVGLLSIGEEKSKGNELIFQSHALLAGSCLNFAGNVEGRDILTSKVDVVVTDGFIGNIVLKFAESVEGYLTSKLRRQVSTNIFSRVGAALMKPFLRRLRQAFDYAEYGGAPLLGADGVSIICHGSSSPKAIKNGVATAAKMARHNINGKIRHRMNETINGNGNAENDQRQNNGDRIIRSTRTAD